MIKKLDDLINVIDRPTLLKAMASFHLGFIGFMQVDNSYAYLFPAAAEKINKDLAALSKKFCLHFCSRYAETHPDEQDITEAEFKQVLDESAGVGSNS